MTLKKPDWYYHQSAVIPYQEENGNTKVLLITTRKSKKWTIPKGIVEPHLNPEESALEEAYEEAGIEGELHKGVFDTFEYNKWGGTCFVQVYLMKITRWHNNWPEDYSRTRKTFSPEKAIQMIGRKEIQPVLKKFELSVG